jgi:hypothetical protein
MERVICNEEAARVLRVVRDEVLTDELHWTQGSYARDVEGKICPTITEEAVMFCLIGACARAGFLLQQRHPGGEYVPIGPATSCLEHNVAEFTRGDKHSVIGFNDGEQTKFQDVRGLLDFVLGDTDGRKTESSEAGT